MKIILVKNKTVKISDEDYAKVAQYNWYVNSNGYIRTNMYINGKKHPTYLQHLVMGKPKRKYIFVDHINGDKTDNRRENLRWVDKTANNHNTDKTTARSGYRGVFWFGRGRAKPWRAGVTNRGKFTSLGYYATPEEAKEARELYFKIQGLRT